MTAVYLLLLLTTVSAGPIRSYPVPVVPDFIWRNRA